MLAPQNLESGSRCHSRDATVRKRDADIIERCACSNYRDHIGFLKMPYSWSAAPNQPVDPTLALDDGLQPRRDLTSVLAPS